MSIAVARFDTIGLPIIANDTMLRSGSPSYLNDSHLIVNILINIVIFLSCLLWFTLVFNIVTRGWKDTDNKFLLFAIWFVFFTVISVYLLLQIKKYL